MPAEPGAEPYDVAVVGGGASGVYAAWRLAAAGQRVALFELSDRVGGRIETVVPPGMPDVRAELGAMRFCAAHTMVCALVSHLGLTVQAFHCNEQRELYLRRVFVTKTVPPPYQVAPSERQPLPVVFQAAIERVVPGAFALSEAALAERVAITEYRGRPLRDWGFWNLLIDLLTSEAYQLLLDAFGVESAFSNWSAEAAIGLLVPILRAAWDGSGTGFSTLGGGMATLPLTLADRLCEGGGEVWLGHRLVTVRAAEVDSRPGVEVEFEVAGVRRRYLARSAILALPPRALELLDRDAMPWGNREWPDLLTSVLREPAFRLYLAYDAAWWRELGWSAGYSITTLPVKNVFYWAASHTADRQRALLMAAYSDATSVAFWRPLQTEPWYVGRAPAGAELEELPPLPVMPSNAPEPMVATAQAQLAELHARAIPPPYAACYRDWSADPYGAGWHAWKPGVALADTIRAVRHPVDAPLYVCGEGFSSMQGWIEGALRSAEVLLREQFGLAPPGWLPPGTYIGP